MRDALPIVRVSARFVRLRVKRGTLPHTRLFRLLAGVIGQLRSPREAISKRHGSRQMSRASLGLAEQLSVDEACLAGGLKAKLLIEGAGEFVVSAGDRLA